MTSAWLRCLVAAVLFGAATPVSKVLLGDVGPLTLSGLLYAGAALATLPFALWRGGWKRPSRANGLRLAGAVIGGGAIAPVLLLAGLARASSAGSVSLWLNLETAATALLSWAFFREHLGARVWGAVAFLTGAGALLSIGEPAGTLVPAALVCGACVCWGLDNNLSALIDGFTAEQTTCIKGVFAGSVNLALGFLLEPNPPSTKTIVVSLLVGTLAYGASIVLHIVGSQQLGATRAQVIFSANPFVGLVLAWAWLGEPVRSVQLVAVAVTVGGLWLLQAAKHDHAHAHPSLKHTHLHRHDDGHHGHTHPGLPPDAEHTHEHAHDEVKHAHPHVPDLHHRH